jgi:hypothetical protein
MQFCMGYKLNSIKENQDFIKKKPKNQKTKKNKQ